MLFPMTILKPPRLRRGDVIGLISPASTPLPTEKIEKGARYLEGLGYRVKLGEHVAAQHGYFAGTDAERLSDLNAMLNDSRVNAIFAIRGGYGSPRLLPFVDYRAVRLGLFTHCKPGDPAKPHLELAEIFDQVLSWMKAPAVEGLQYGHVSRKLTLPFGLQARLDANRGTLSVLESSVE